MHGPQLQIVVRRADDDTWSAQLADYCTIGAEGYPTGTGAVNALVAQVENGEGWDGLWAQAEAEEEAMWGSVLAQSEIDQANEEQALANSVRRLDEVCAAGPTADEAFVGLTDPGWPAARMSQELRDVLGTCRACRGHGFQSFECPDCGR